MPSNEKRFQNAVSRSSPQSYPSLFTWQVSAPTGRLALVFTDIQDSCALWESSPEAMSSAIGLHDHILRNELRIYDGYEVKTQGDGFMASFSSAAAALLWSISVQTALSNATWPIDIQNRTMVSQKFEEHDIVYRGLVIRIGAHSGVPICKPNPVTKRMDYFGDMVNRASRITSLAAGGEIIVSKAFLSEAECSFVAETRHDRLNSVGSQDTLVEDAETGSTNESNDPYGGNFKIRDLGMRSLRGLEKLEHLYLVLPRSDDQSAATFMEKCDQSGLL